MTAALLAVALGLSAPPADAEVRLEKARVCYAALDFACAERELARLRVDLDALPEPRRADILRLSAETALSRHRSDEARAHLDRLLALDPRFAPESGRWPPAWLEVLEGARRAAPDRLPPSLLVTVPARLRPGEGFEIAADADDPSGVGRVTLFFAGGEAASDPVSLATTDGRRWTTLVPPDHVRGDAFLFRLEAFDRLGNGPAVWGTAADPIRIPVAPAPVLVSNLPPSVVEPPSLLRRWWFWTAAGAVLAGTGALIYVLADGETGGSSEPGAVVVGFNW